MRITKKSATTTASKEVKETTKKVTSSKATSSGAGIPLRSVVNSSEDNKKVACQHIKSAIDALGASAITGSQEAKDAIANLSVILLELK
jgi:hypothetical protein